MKIKPIEILNGKLQRIVGVPCSPEDPECLDLNLDRKIIATSIDDSMVGDNNLPSKIGNIIYVP